MALLAQKSQYTVPASGITYLFGSGIRFWLSVAVDVVAGQSTGTGITVSITGRGPPQVYLVEYGSPALTIPCYANLVTVTGTGAVIELLLSTDHVVVSPLTLTAGTVAISGIPDINIKEIAGVAQTGSPQIASIETSVGVSAGAVQSIGGTPMVATSIQDPPQVIVTGGKAVPVKTET